MDGYWDESMIDMVPYLIYDWFIDSLIHWFIQYLIYDWYMIDGYGDESQRGVSIVMGVPQVRWMVFVRENPI